MLFGADELVVVVEANVLDAASLVLDADGDVEGFVREGLVGLRTGDSNQGGAWRFPGGCRPGVLDRFSREDLGYKIGGAEAIEESIRGDGAIILCVVQELYPFWGNITWRWVR